MEALLDLYEEPADPTRPRVCLDEVPLQLLAERHTPTPAQPGQAARRDFSYARQGTCNLFVLYCPDRGWRHVLVTDRRTKADLAHVLRAVVEEYFPDATQVRLILDNLPTHTPAVLYTVFPPADARRLARKLSWHFTPKHASWLNQVELENSALARQCLRRRFADQASLAQAIAAWEAARNAAQVTVDWRFTARDARTKLQRLYPELSDST